MYAPCRYKPLQFGCSNHKFDNSLKAITAAFKRVWSAHPEWKSPILFPNKYQKSRVEHREEFEGVMCGGLDQAYLCSILLVAPNVKGQGIQKVRGGRVHLDSTQYIPPGMT